MAFLCLLQIANVMIHGQITLCSWGRANRTVIKNGIFACEWCVKDNLVHTQGQPSLRGGIISHGISCAKIDLTHGGLLCLREY